MLKKVFFIAVCTLLIPYATAQSRSLMPKKEQPKDFRYYQIFHWNKKIERKVMYEAIANGQFHMYEKMSACKTETVRNVEDWLIAFKTNPEEVKFTESDKGMRDMDDNEIRDPDYGKLVAKWLLRDYIEKRHSFYTGENLHQMQDEFWIYCLGNLSIKPFTKAVKDKFEAKIQAEIAREASYP
ncbi:hypothetical protein [Rheinheimera sp. WS51]|uniref:hypothetical protein n=1 Tax=Rheinheimera sp. WS51 TaxID=3425886 RepID=UPI003D8EA11D